MSILVLPQSMVRDRDDGIKANAQHVDDNFNALASAVNGKLDLDGTSTPTADITMGNHKLINVATPTSSGDAATKGYVDNGLVLKANASDLATYAPIASPTFTGTPEAPTPSTTDDSTKIATTAFVIDVLETIYPVGSVYIGTQNTCPMSSLFGTWTLVSSGKALWTGDGTNGNTTIPAGLPNVTGKMGINTDTATNGWRLYGTHQNSGAWSNATGALYHADSSTTGKNMIWDTLFTPRTGTIQFQLFANLGFDASKSNSIYGASSTVQPPAYVVNVWKRTA